MKRLIHALILGGALISGTSPLRGSSFGLEYTTEWQTDFHGGCDWLNLLRGTAELSLYRGLTFEAATISTAKTGGDPLLDDLLTYSNIEAGNIPLTFARLGLGLSVKDAEFFAGINNVNEDYFTSELTSLFTNSSFGITPTISCNFDIANYPLASWCLHYRQQLGDWSVQTSLYPGQGYSRLFGKGSLFRLNIKQDGIFSISSLDYTRNGIYCVLGVALHYGHSLGDATGESESAEAGSGKEGVKRFAAAPWVLTEISLPANFGLVAHGSWASVKRGCKWYGGVGVTYTGKRVQPGVAFNYASWSDATEYSVELTCRIPVWGERLDVQPALHVVGTDGGSPGCVGMLRASFKI